MSQYLQSAQSRAQYKVQALGVFEYCRMILGLYNMALQEQSRMQIMSVLI